MIPLLRHRRDQVTIEKMYSHLFIVESIRLGPADYVLDPRHGVLAFPLAVFLVGILPAVRIKKARIWLLLWLIFLAWNSWSLLKIGAQKDTADVFMLGDFVVRLPYAWMFQYIPGMSRMFAPYRMASMVVVCAVIFGCDKHGSFKRNVEAKGGFVLLFAIVLQPFYRFDLLVWQNGMRDHQCGAYHCKSLP